VSRNESQQRRALLLPQEFKELGSERLVVIFENCKPILGEKIRYHRDKVFMDRLRRAPVVPRMNMDLHLARTQQRVRDADDELPPGQVFTFDELAHDFSELKVPDATGSAAEWDAFLEGYFQKTLVPATAQATGGAIEPATEAPAPAMSPSECAVDHDRSDITTET
jgi:type IV secretion system protein VirD4